MIVRVDGLTLDSAEQPHVPAYEQILLCPIPSKPHVLLQPCERKRPTSQSRSLSVLLVHLLLNLVSSSALGRSTVQLLKHASELHLGPQTPGGMKPSSSGQPLECEDLMLLLCFQNFQNESRGILAQAAIDEWLVQSPSIACNKFRGCQQRQPVEGPGLSASHVEHRSTSWYHFSSPLAPALPGPEAIGFGLPEALPFSATGFPLQQRLMPLLGAPPEMLMPQHLLEIVVLRQHLQHLQCPLRAHCRGCLYLLHLSHPGYFLRTLWNHPWPH
mmetsp:Transcript_2705/g.4765  ORF Transcript_2705/g.4765 Transcript_2705/m.4765 type:complete len:272 (-) Transcript_2705:60-875(-)